MIELLLSISIEELPFTGKEIIPVFFYILGFYLIYLHLDKREELIRFDKSNIEIYKRTRRNMKEDLLFPVIKEIIQKFYEISLQEFGYNTSIENHKGKEIRGIVFSETIELLKQFIKEKENFETLFHQANFQTVLEKLNRGTDKILDLDTTWKNIKKFGKITNYCICILLPLAFISLPVLIINMDFIWILWGVLFVISVLFCFVFHNYFSKNKDKFDKYKEEYYVGIG